MASTAEKLELIQQIAALRKCLREYVSPDQRNLMNTRLAELEAQKLAAEEAEAPPPPKRVTDARISPAEAAKRAKAIRARAEFWDPQKIDAEGRLLVTREQHQQLRQELLEYDERAGAAEDKGNGGP